MKVLIDVYGYDGYAEVSAAELETFSAVLSRLRTVGRDGDDYRQTGERPRTAIRILNADTVVYPPLEA